MGQSAEVTPEGHAAVSAPDHGHPEGIGLDLALSRTAEPLPFVIATRAVLVVPIMTIPTAPPIDRQVHRAGDERCRPHRSIRAPPTLA